MDNPPAPCKQAGRAGAAKFGHATKRQVGNEACKTCKTCKANNLLKPTVHSRPHYLAVVHLHLCQKSIGTSHGTLRQACKKQHVVPLKEAILEQSSSYNLERHGADNGWEELHRGNSSGDHLSDDAWFCFYGLLSTCVRLHFGIPEPRLHCKVTCSCTAVRSFFQAAFELFPCLIYCGSQSCSQSHDAIVPNCVTSNRSQM